MTDLTDENRLLNALADVLALDAAKKDRRITELESALLAEQREGEGMARTILELRRNQRREWSRVGHMAEVIDLQNEHSESDRNEIMTLTRERDAAVSLNHAYTAALGRAS